MKNIATNFPVHPGDDFLQDHLNKLLRKEALPKCCIEIKTGIQTTVTIPIDLKAQY